MISRRLVLRRGDMEGSLRARRETLVSRVAPLAKGLPLSARRTLRSAVSRPADPTDLTVTEY